jgi:hypothetical protein
MTTSNDERDVPASAPTAVEAAVRIDAARVLSEAEALDWLRSQPGRDVTVIASGQVCAIVLAGSPASRRGAAPRCHRHRAARCRRPAGHVAGHQQRRPARCDGRQARELEHRRLRYPHHRRHRHAPCAAAHGAAAKARSRAARSRPLMTTAQHTEWEQSRDQAISDGEIDLGAGSTAFPVRRTRKKFCDRH